MRSEDVVMPLGKYKGRTLGEIADEDLLSLDWLNGLEDLRPPLLQAVADICTRFSHEIDSLLIED